MDKNTYLKELSRCLSRWMPEREREDTLRWHEEYFQEAGPEREAEIIEELGPPDALAQRLSEEGGWTRRKKSAPKWELFAGIAVAALLLAAALAVGLWAATRPDNSAGGLSPNTSAGPENSLAVPDTPPTGVSPAPSADPTHSADPTPSADPAPSQSQDPGSDPVQAVDAFATVEVGIALGDVVLRAEGDAFRVEAEYSGETNGEPYRIEYEVAGGKLNVVSHPRSVNQKDGDDRCQARVTVTVPAGRALDRVDIKTGLGDIDLGAVETDRVDLNTGLGDVKVHGAAADSITLHTGLGDLAVEDVSADSLDLKNGLGDIDLRGAPAGEMELQTGMGEITIRLDCAMADCAYGIHTGMGISTVVGSARGKDVEQSVPGATYHLKATTGMGDISLSFGDGQ